MLIKQVKAQITYLSDSALVEYILHGPRRYKAEAIDFAQRELDRRQLSQEQLAALRAPIVARLAILDAKQQAGKNHLSDPSDAIVCQNCGREAPNRFVTYHEHTGAIVIGFHKTYRGNLCRDCNHKFFKSATLHTFLFGWWGIKSFFYTILYLICNLVNYGKSFSILPVPAQAAHPVCDDTVVDKIAPHLQLLADRLSTHTNVTQLSREIATLADITPGQALCFIQTMLQKQAAAKSNRSFKY